MIIGYRLLLTVLKQFCLHHRICSYEPSDYLSLRTICHKSSKESPSFQCEPRCGVLVYTECRSLYCTPSMYIEVLPWSKSSDDFPFPASLRTVCHSHWYHNYMASHPCVYDDVFSVEFLEQTFSNKSHKNI